MPDSTQLIDRVERREVAEIVAREDHPPRTDVSDQRPEGLPLVHARGSQLDDLPTRLDGETEVGCQVSQRIGERSRTSGSMPRVWMASARPLSSRRTWSAPCSASHPGSRSASWAIASGRATGAGCHRSRVQRSAPYWPRMTRPFEPRHAHEPAELERLRDRASGDDGDLTEHATEVGREPRPSARGRRPASGSSTMCASVPSKSSASSVPAGSFDHGFANEERRHAPPSLRAGQDDRQPVRTHVGRRWA